MIRHAPVVLAALALGVTGCAASPRSASPRVVPAPSAVSPTVATVSPEASPDQPISAYLPSQLDGLELHTFAVAQDVTDRLAGLLGPENGPLEVSHASEHGARFIQMLAIRAPGARADRLRTLFPAAAFPPDGTSAEITELELGGVPVQAVTEPAAASRLGTYYLLERDDVLIVVQAFDPADAEAAIRALP